MAKKKKLNKLNHAFVVEWLGKDWYRDDQGRITDSEGTYAGDKLNKVINDQYPQVADASGKKSKETLEKAFPKTYEEPREKQRSAGRQKDQTDKEAQEYKRDTQELRSNINAISSLMRENSALIRQQLATQQRSITLLSEIANNVKNSGGLGGGKVLGLKSSLALGLGGLAVGGIAGYMMGGGNGGDDEDEKPQPPQQQPPQQSAAIQEAQKRGEDENQKVLTVNAKEIYYNSDRLTFNVQDLMIDAEKIVNEISKGQNQQTSISAPPSAPPPVESPMDSKKPGGAGAAGAPGGMPTGAGGNTTAAAPAPAAAVEPTNKPPVAGATDGTKLKDVKDQNGNVIAQVPDYGPGKLEPRKGLFDTLFGQSDEEKKAILAKTQDIEKNGAVSTVMGDIGMPALPQGASEPPKPAAAPITPAAKPKATATTKTIMVDDPNWDRHSQSKKMFEEATARENRGENSQSMYWAAEAQRKKELAASPPQIKKTIKVAAAAPAPTSGAIGASSNPYGEGDPLAQVSAERVDPETLGDKPIPAVTAIQDANDRQNAVNAIGARFRGDANRQRAAEEAKRQDAVRMQGIDDADSARRPGEIGELGKIQQQDKAMDAGASLVESGARITPRNLARGIKGPEYGKESSASGAFAEPSGDSLYPEQNQGNSNTPDPVDKDRPMTPSSTHRAFDYLFEKGKKVFNLDFGS